MKVIADVIDAADGPKITLLSLLDMSAAFDTVDHAILLRRLELSRTVSVAVAQRSSGLPRSCSTEHKSLLLLVRSRRHSVFFVACRRGLF